MCAGLWFASGVAHGYIVARLDATYTGGSCWVWIAIKQAKSKKGADRVSYRGREGIFSAFRVLALLILARARIRPKPCPPVRSAGNPCKHWAKLGQGAKGCALSALPEVRRFPCVGEKHRKTKEGAENFSARGVPAVV